MIWADRWPFGIPECSSCLYHWNWGLKYFCVLCCSGRQRISLFTSSVMYRVTFVLLKFGISGKFCWTVLMLCVAVLESPPGFLCSFVSKIYMAANSVNKSLMQKMCFPFISWFYLSQFFCTCFALFHPVSRGITPGSDPTCHLYMKCPFQMKLQHSICNITVSTACLNISYFSVY